MKRILALLLLLLSKPVMADFTMTQTHCDIYVTYLGILYQNKDVNESQSDALRDIASWIARDPSQLKIDLFPLLLTSVDMVYNQTDPQDREQRIAVQSKHCDNYIGKTIH